jgi:hypothetical protein
MAKTEHIHTMIVISGAECVKKTVKGTNTILIKAIIIECNL